MKRLTGRELEKLIIISRCPARIWTTSPDARFYLSLVRKRYATRREDKGVTEFRITPDGRFRLHQALGKEASW